MKVIGLTGGIGSGKSTASRYIQSKGFPVIDTDEISREITGQGSPLLEVLIGLFGQGILQKDGNLDRKGLGDIVFQDPKKRQQLEDIMHEKIREIMEERIAVCKAGGGNKACFIEAPLLFEAEFQKSCDVAWLIVADYQTKIQRIQNRDGLTIESIKARMNSQMSDEEKRELADVIIDNTQDRSKLYQRLDQLLEAI